MKTAKLVAYMAALLLLFNLSAAGQVRFGVKAGLNLANIDYKTPVDNAHDILPTFQVGGVVEIGLAEAIAINTGVLLQGKGYRYTKENDAYTAKYSSNPIYLQVPVQLVLHGKGVYAAIGPYAAVGVMGKEKFELIPANNETGVIDEKADLIFGNDQTDDLRMFETGAGVELGYESKLGLLFTFNYQVGFTDTRPSYYSDAYIGEKATNWAASFCVTYLLDLQGNEK